jgi:hypothetical protein
MIDQQLTTFLHDGVGIHLGTRNAAFEPNGARAISVRVDPDGKHITVYMAAVAAERVLPDLESNGQAAVVLARPTDERACQVKGTFVSAGPVNNESEQAASLAQWTAFLDNLEYIGIPRSSADTWIHVAEVAIRLKVTAVFEQTPGPHAGQALA